MAATRSETPNSCSRGFRVSIKAASARSTESPRHYGFHATLKAPFALADGTTRGELAAALEGFAARSAGFEMAPLQLGDIDGFLALTLARDEPALQQLADYCVREFDRFRATADPG